MRAKAIEELNERARLEWARAENAEAQRDALLAAAKAVLECPAMNEDANEDEPATVEAANALRAAVEAVEGNKA